MIDITEEYIDITEDAIGVVKEYIGDKHKIDEDLINVLDHSYITSKDIQDDDIVLVLTDFGLYESCYDCERIEEIIIPKEYARPVSLFYDNNYPNLIIVGFMEQGLIISRDKGLTWENIYAASYLDKVANPSIIKEVTSNKIEINYLKSGNKWKYEVENNFSGSPKQVFIMNQEILGESLIDDKLYNELNISFEGISAEGQKYYYRADEEAIFAVLDQDKGNEYIDIKLPLSLNLEWETKNKFQDVIQKVQGRQNYIFNGVEYKDCYKISFEGEYYGRKVNGYQIYNYDIGYLYVEINYSEGKQIIRLKEFFSN